MATRPKIAASLAQIEHGSEFEACEASKLLGEAKGTRLIADLTRILRTGLKPYSREAAAYALTWQEENHWQSARSLLACASDPDEQDSVRGQALEGLALQLNRASRRLRLRCKAEDLMIQLLQSSSPLLRFWSCYGLAILECQRSVPHLRKLQRADKSVCPGWWYVQEEAEDAIAIIAGRAPQDRLPMHMRKDRKIKSKASPNQPPRISPSIK